MKWKVCLYLAATTIAFFVIPDLLLGQTHENSAVPMERENQAMGFDQANTTHHFTLLANGGTIEITANDPSDIATRDAIREHLARIAAMFGQGDFNVPTLVHGQTPPAVDTLKRLKSELSYTPENLPKGGRVQITTSNSEALKAVHDFLRFQIQEHKTGDSLAEPGPAKRKHSTNNLGHDARPAPP
jgi:uncharacterized protein YjhX (UPF0386 family)